MSRSRLEDWLERARHRAGDPRALRRSATALIILVAIMVIIRLLVDPIATHYTRKELNEAEGMRGEFQRVHVTLFPPGYEIRRIKIIEHPGGSWKRPLFYAERIAATVDWRELLHARLAASARVDQPKVIFAKAKPAEKAKEAKAKVPNVRAMLDRMLPARLDRLEVRDGELLFRDLGAEREPEVWVHDLQITAENLATRRKLEHGRPATLSVRGKMGRSGLLSAFVSADPLAKKLDFAGNFEVKGWQVAELYDFIQPATKLQTPHGTLDVFAEFKAHDGEITGGVKPVLKNVEVRSTEQNIGNELKAGLTDTALHIFSDRVPGRNAVATVVPIKGRLDDPDIQLWPTVLGVIRNAFVEGISSGFAHLPPPTAEKKEGALSQAKHALNKEEGPPKAQPEKPKPDKPKEKEKEKEEGK
jgi:uncharacterized protein YhdP